MNIQFSASALGTRNLSGLAGFGGGANLIRRSLFAPDPPIDPSLYYVPGAGSPAVSTADYYGINGLWQAQPYDLLAMGTDGATIATRESARYIWMLAPDHPEGVNFLGSGGFFVGYSNDPQIWPDPSTVRLIRAYDESMTFVDEFGYTQITFLAYQFPRLVYNPDSAGNKFWIYCESFSVSSSRQHELGLMTTPDFIGSATLVGAVIATGDITRNASQGFNGWTSIGYVTRVSTGVWYALSFSNRINTVGISRWLSTDGLTWTLDATVTEGSVAGPGPYVTISGTTYLIAKETGVAATYLALTPVNAKFQATGPVVRISDAFGGDTGDTSAYPGPKYFQSASAYEEDGIASIYCTRGFFASGASYSLNPGPYSNIATYAFNITATCSGTSLVVTAIDQGGILRPGQELLSMSGQPTIVSGPGGGGVGTYVISSPLTISTPTSIKIPNNGGLWQQFVDQYFYITDATVAADAAPLGIVAKCVAGTVTVSWNACPPGKSYRVYKGTSSSQTTLVGDVTGTSIQDTPTTGQQWFYKVVSLNGGVEKKSRVVNCYVS